MSKTINFRDIEGEHRPIQSNRRGELLAWLSGIGVACGGLLIAWRSGGVPGLAVSAAILFFGIASVISFGNWVERRTLLQISEDNIRYQSPLRHRVLTWEQIGELRLAESSRGWRIHVLSEEGSFYFQSQGRLQFADLDSMDLGFPFGINIAAFIREQSDLTECHFEGSEWIYSRME